MSIFGQKHNLPASLTSFVGRRKELEQIRQLMNTARLLTLIDRVVLARPDYR